MLSLSERIVEAGGMSLFYAAESQEKTVLVQCHRTGLILWVDGLKQYITDKKGEILATASVTVSLLDTFADAQIATIIH